MITRCVLVAGLVGLAGCDQPQRGYGSNYRPSPGGNYSRGYDRNTDQRDRDDRSRQQNSRGNPGSSGNRGNIWNFQGNAPAQQGN